MTIWGTVTGRKWVKNLLGLCRMEQHRILVVTGGLDMSFLCDARLGIPLSEIIEVSSPEKLADLDIRQDNRIVLLRSLVCEVQINVEKGLDITRTFCNTHKYKLVFGPYSVSSSDIAHLKEEALTGKDNIWETEISHYIAISLSKGIIQCYCELIGIFEQIEKQSPDVLPSAGDCLERYIELKRYSPSFDQIRSWFLRQKNLMIRHQENFQDSWIILWSAGLACMVNNEWELVPALLEGPGLVGERMHRVTEANNINIPPIYMAWVYYCEKKYKLREEEANGIVIRYPADVYQELRAIEQVDEADLQLCREVRDLRNWLQHGENYDRSVYQNDYMCHRTCKTVIRKMMRNGRERA